MLFRVEKAWVTGKIRDNEKGRIDSCLASIDESGGPQSTAEAVASFLRKGYTPSLLVNSYMIDQYQSTKSERIISA
jgi:hypothetical protein